MRCWLPGAVWGRGGKGGAAATLPARPSTRPWAEGSKPTCVEVSFMQPTCVVVEAVVQVSGRISLRPVFLSNMLRGRSQPVLGAGAGAGAGARCRFTGAGAESKGHVVSPQQP